MVKVEEGVGTSLHVLDVHVVVNDVVDVDAVLVQEGVGGQDL